MAKTKVMTPAKRSKRPALPLSITKRKSHHFKIAQAPNPKNIKPKITFNKTIRNFAIPTPLFGLAGSSIFDESSPTPRDICGYTLLLYQSASEYLQEWYPELKHLFLNLTPVQK